MGKVTEETKQAVHEILAMPEAERFDLLHKLAQEGFVITITLKTDKLGMLSEFRSFFRRKKNLNNRKISKLSGG